MRKRNHHVSGPRGGLRAGAAGTRGWRWNGPDQLASVPVRCKRAQWYLARGRSTATAGSQRAAVLLRFLHRDETISERVLALHAVADNGLGSEMLGWVQTPEDATHLQLCLPEAAQAGLFEEIVFHAVAERDPTCHPLANVPRWTTYQPPLPIERVLLPPSLECLTPLLTDQDVQIVRPRSAAHLAGQIRGAACVLDPAWEAELGLRLAHLERLAAESWLVVDLETLWKLARRAGLEKAQLVTWRSPHGIMSARVEYADVATRGFALQDVFPCATIDEAGGFALRVLRANRAWKRYADEEGFATLLSSETPTPAHCGDVISAARPIGRGELIATDLPWLVASRHGSLLAPRLARHALRMHLAGPIADDVQYWNRWDESQFLVRDIADLERRYPPLRAIRWACPDGVVVHLGVALPASVGGFPGNPLIISTERIDHLATHDGLPPEPMIIFMKLLAREAREQTEWARRHLHGLTVIWQFDSAAGRRYAANYASAAPFVSGRPRIIRLTQAADAVGNTVVNPPGAGLVETVIDDVGLLGDGSLAFQTQLSARLRRLIEHIAAGAAGGL